MKSLAHYLVTARDYLEGYRGVEKVKALFKEDPALFESAWQDLFRDKGSYLVKEFMELLDEKGLYIQYEKYAPRNPIGTRPITLDLRVYTYSTDVGKVACLKVTVIEQRPTYVG